MGSIEKDFFLLRVLDHVEIVYMLLKWNLWQSWEVKIESCTTSKAIARLKSLFWKSCRSIDLSTTLKSNLVVFHCVLCFVHKCIFPSNVMLVL